MHSWAPVFHFYQPPTQHIYLTKEIAHSCYLPLLDVFLKYPNARATFNLSGSLLIQLESLGMRQFIESVRTLSERGQIDLLISPMFHPLLPLTPPDVISDMMVRSKNYFAYLFPNTKVAGVFPPELAVNEQVVELIGKFGPILIDQGSVDKKFQDKHKCHFKGINLLINNREVTELIRSYPKELSAKRFVDHFKKTVGEICVSANDAEIFGHHYRERINFLIDLFSKESFNFMTFSEANEKLGKGIEVSEILTSSWQTSELNLKGQNPLPLWKDSKNGLQKKYYDLCDFVYNTVSSQPIPENDPGLTINSAWEHYYRGISSCHTYWLSNWPWWHPDLVQAGATELIKAVRTLPVGKEVKFAGEALYHDLLHNIWQYQWSGKVEERYAEYGKYLDELLKKTPDI